MVLLVTLVVRGEGNLLEAEVEALVNTVNTVGVMGKGIALQFKKAFPKNFKEYEVACRNGEVRLGSVHVHHIGGWTNPKWILNFPTKGHWRARSKLTEIEAGLDDLRNVINDNAIGSIALPPLGCGNGGLSWAEVEPLILRKLDDLDLELHIYPPAGAPLAADIRVAEERPNLTVARAVLLTIMSRYAEASFAAVSLIEIQKLMYFAQAAGEELRLSFTKSHYGPYADGIRHVIGRMEGHYLQGFGDGSKPVREAEPLRLLPAALEEADALLEGNEEVKRRMTRVLGLVDGFESPYGLELLATVHWAVSHSDTQISLDEVVEIVQSWSQRKRRMFTSDHIAVAFDRLHDELWMPTVPVG